MASLKLRSVKTFSLSTWRSNLTLPTPSGQKMCGLLSSGSEGNRSKSPAVLCHSMVSWCSRQTNSGMMLPFCSYPFSLAISKLSQKSFVAHISFVTHSTILNCRGNSVSMCFSIALPGSHIKWCSAWQRLRSVCTVLRIPPIFIPDPGSDFLPSRIPNQTLFHPGILDPHQRI